MHKILLKDAYPELAEQVVDKELLQVLGVSDKRRVLWCCEHGHAWEAPVANRVNKCYGCPYCSGRLPIAGETDLATVMPELCKELVDTSLGLALLPTSHRKVSWRCDRGHIWEASVASRVNSKSGCPYCSGRLAIEGETDLATTHPELARELVNVELGKKLKAGSNKKVEWMCFNGHTYAASPNSRTHMGSGCPVCAGKRIILGKNDLASVRPDLAKELVDQSLGEQLFVTSNRKVEWFCKHGHTWEALVSNRSQFGYGCPECVRTSTSFVEQFLYHGFVTMLGKDAVRNRDIEQFGFEIDVLLPSLSVGIEFGSWHWHESKVVRDKKKRDVCARAGYKLITIYDSIPDDAVVPFADNFYRYDFDLGQEPAYLHLHELFGNLCRDVGVNFDSDMFDWDSIAKKALKTSRKST